MLGIRYMKTNLTQYVLHYQNGKLAHHGPGISFFYYQPSASIAVIPISSTDVPFIFSEMSADYQSITIQGQVTYRIEDPMKVAMLLDYTVDGKPDHHTSEDPEKLDQRLVNLIQVLARAEVQNLPLKRVIHASDEVADEVFSKLKNNETLFALGVGVLALSIQAIKPVPEISRALEAEAREALLRRADEAIYDRRNSAVEQERRIKENELNTEIAIEEKKRQIRETRVAAELAVEAKEQQVREAKMAGEISLEEERRRLVNTRAKNARAEADLQAYAVEASLRPIKELDPNMLELLAVQSTEPRLMISMAMKEIAKNAAKIGNLNISPDLLEQLLA